MAFWIKRLFSVHGRAGNLEFFVINLGGFGLMLLPGFVESKYPIPEWLTIIWGVILAVPQITVRIRRWHDMGNGWPFIFIDLIFLPLMTFVHLVAPGNEGTNEYGDTLQLSKPKESTNGGNPNDSAQ